MNDPNDPWAGFPTAHEATGLMIAAPLGGGVLIGSLIELATPQGMGWTLAALAGAAVWIGTLPMIPRLFRAARWTIGQHTRRKG